MEIKRWSTTQVPAPALQLKEKQKWQIALRRYVIEKKASVFYAPYFGLDVNHLRMWFELQFENESTWDSFGKKWQFDHVIPVTYFDFSSKEELSVCWNFTNMTINQQLKNEGKKDFNLSKGKKYFEKLYVNTRYIVLDKLLSKIDDIEMSQNINCDKQENFIIHNKPYLDMIQNYSTFEFELLNNGRSIEEVNKEVDFMKKFESQV